MSVRKIQVPTGPETTFTAIPYPLAPEVAGILQVLGVECVKAGKDLHDACGDSTLRRAAEKKHAEAQSVLCVFLDAVREHVGVEHSRREFLTAA